MSDPQATHLLYHFNFSICSLYVRYAVALRGITKSVEHEILVEEKHIDLTPPRLDQLCENFICNIHSRGEVPVLVTKQDGTVLPDSRRIIYSIADNYPDMVPKEKEREITRLLNEIHKIEYFSLTFAGKYEYVGGAIANLLEMINRDGISDRYRDALCFKIKCIEQREIPALMNANVEGAVHQTKKVLSEVEGLLSTSRTAWLLNTVHPTALDAHVVVLVARLQDVFREALIPDRVKTFAETAMMQQEWRDTMQGRRTVPPGGF